MFLSLFILLAWFTAIATIKIPFVSNVTLVSKFPWGTTMLQNHTCSECLCLTVLSNVTALNCFPNSTCQLFFTVPRSYKLQPTPRSILYFPNGILPNASQCCMPNLTYVIERLKNSTQQMTPTLGPRCLSLDDRNRLATVETSLAYVNLFDGTSLVNLSRTQPSTISVYRSLAFHDGAYYIGMVNDNILVVDSTNLSVQNTIVSAYLSGVRDMLFLNDGRTMVVASGGNNQLVFFTRSLSSPTNYTFAYQQHINCNSAHGMWRVDDDFFYVTSWDGNKIYSYQSVNETSWAESLVVDALPIVPISNGFHVSVDECDRLWFSLGDAGVLIFSNQGILLGNLSFLATYAFDALVLENYVLYMSSYATNRVLRLNPNIEC